MKIDKIPSDLPAAAPTRTPGGENKALAAVSRQYESMFVNQLVSQMRRTVVKQGIVPESSAERIYQSMLDEKHSEVIAETGQLGLAKLIYEHLLRQSQ